MRLSDLTEEVSSTNPLDMLERVIDGESWPAERACDDELAIAVQGQWTDYNLTFSWREDLEALHLACAFDMRVPKQRQGEIARLLALLNEQMWIGHFDLWSEEGILLYRHGVLMNGGASLTAEQGYALIQLSIESCERYYPAFQFVLWGGKSATEAVEACMFDVEGSA